MTGFPWHSRETVDNGFVLWRDKEVAARPREWVITANWGGRIVEGGRWFGRDHVVVTLYRDFVPVYRTIKKEGAALSDSVLECVDWFAELARDEPSGGVNENAPSFIAGYLYRGLRL